MVGRVLNNRYTMTERVGIGGMAEVYAANDSVLGRLVAVKVMLPQYAADPTFTQRFRQEAASAAKLQSPYIVSIYDWGLDGDTYYIVMEYLRGTDLKSAISQRGAINQYKVAEIGSQVAQALSVAHDGGIIHRDIKPQNIMIQPDGNIKVMDFGIARAGDAGLSQTSTVLGTAHYVSPEQAQGKELTGSSDIYSLGIVMYEAATGRLPFEGTDAVSVAVKQVNEAPIPPRDINPDIAPDLEAIIMCALQKDPANRFANASDMRRALNDFLAGRPVTLPAGFMETQVISGVNGDETVVMGGVGQDATRVMPISHAGAGQDATRVMNRGNQHVYSNPEPEKKSKKGPIIAVLCAIAIIALAAVAFFTMGNGEDKVPVPDVSNQPLSQAESELREAGFEIGTVTEVFNADVESGTVISTSPAAGQKAAQGSTVNISVSKGNESVTVPDLSNMTPDAALKALSNLGLVGQQGDSVYSDKVGEGKVATQDVPSGSPLDRGRTVVFHLSKGVESVSIPNVVGYTKANAETALVNAGFAASFRYMDDDAPEGEVLYQSETGSAARGTTITLTISNGPAPEPEPEPEPDPDDGTENGGTPAGSDGSTESGSQGGTNNSKPQHGGTGSDDAKGDGSGTEGGSTGSDN